MNVFNELMKSVPFTLAYTFEEKKQMERWNVDIHLTLKMRARTMSLRAIDGERKSNDNDDKTLSIFTRCPYVWMEGTT